MYITTIGPQNILILLTKNNKSIIIYISYTTSNYEYAWHSLSSCILCYWQMPTPVFYTLFVVSLHTIPTVLFLPLLISLMLVCLVFYLFCCSISNNLYQSVHMFHCLYFWGYLVISPFSSFLSPTITLCWVFVFFVLTAQSLFISALLLCGTCYLSCQLHVCPAWPQYVSFFLSYWVWFSSFVLCPLTGPLSCPSIADSWGTALMWSALPSHVCCYFGYLPSYPCYAYFVWAVIMVLIPFFYYCSMGPQSSIWTTTVDPVGIEL